MTVADLASFRLTRERRNIALAHDVFQLLNCGEGEDPTPIQVELQALVQECLALAEGDLVERYRAALAWFAATPGGAIELDADHARHHRDAHEWARTYLARIERDFGLVIMGRLQ